MRARLKFTMRSALRGRDGYIYFFFLRRPKKYHALVRGDIYAHKAQCEIIGSGDCISLLLSDNFAPKQAIVLVSRPQVVLGEYLLVYNVRDMISRLVSNIDKKILSRASVRVSYCDLMNMAL